jgi:type I restriction enzyme S subunit
MVVKPKHQEINIRFLEYFFRGAVDLTKAITGAAQPQITRQSLNPVKFRYPPLPIQNEIVLKLDAVFSGIQKAITATESNIKNTEALFQSYLGSVFLNTNQDWIEATLKDVCEKITDGTHQTPTYFDDGVIFLSSKNVTSGKIDWENIKYIDTKQHIEMSRRVSPKIGDVLLAKNGTTGVAAMVDKDVVFDIYVSLALLRAKEQILPQLLLYFVNSPVAKKQFNKRLKGIGVPNLHLEEIREVEISFPKSLAKQKELIFQIESFLDVTSKQVIRYKSKKTELIKLKNSILQKAFNGELIKE